MAWFHGKFDYSLDAKGRVNIPSKLRKALSPEAQDTFIICRAPNGCLRAYPQDTWAQYENELASRPETPETLRIKRLLYSTISESTLDTQGRILLTQEQMAIAGITKDVVIMGQARYIEIWDKTRFTTYVEGDDFDSVFFQSVEAGIKR
jgi:MraZ protein